MPTNLSVETLVKRFDMIKNNRVNWASHWQELADYCLPQKANVTQIRTPGTKLKTDIYDGTSIQSAQILAAGLHTFLTNPTSRWFALAMKEKELMESFEVKQWLKESEDGLFDYLNQSNFNQKIHENYIDFSVFGTSCLYEEEDPEDEIVFFARPISEIYILTNEKGKIDTVYRDFTYTARQAYQRWGDNAGEKVKQAMENGKIETPISFLHITLPREERNVRKRDARNMPFASLYIEPITKKVLSEGGYEEFPFYIPRFYKVSDSEYGYSPGSIALADIKTLNKMSETILKAAAKTVDPPIILPNDGYILPFKQSPGAINYKSSQLEGEVETLDIKRNIPIGLELEEQKRNKIKQDFFVDLFLLLAERPRMTATEVTERVNEKMYILGPVLGRLMSELLKPIIVRTFNILMRNFKLPQPPDEIAGKEYTIEYISPLAKAQRASESRSMELLLRAVREMMEMNPQVIDTINFDKTVKEMADIYNVSVEILRSDDEIAEIRQLRQQQQEIQKTIEQISQGAEGAQRVIEAEKMLTGGGESGGAGTKSSR